MRGMLWGAWVFLALGLSLYACSFVTRCEGLCGKPLPLPPKHARLQTAQLHSWPRLPACTTGARHERWSLKNRKLPAGEPIVDLTIEQLLTQVVPAPAADVNTQPQDGFEQTLWRLHVVPCLVKESADDCDLHVEVAADPHHCQTGSRVIVEVPASYSREVQLNALDAIGVRILPTHAVTISSWHAVVVVGWGFYDYAHRCAQDVRGCHHGTTFVGTLAELHPAILSREE